MVFYFSGTGNSKYVAQRIADSLNQEVISINQRIKDNDNSKIISTDSLIFVFPTYAWRIPRLVEKWIKETMFSENVDAYFVMTCGSEISNARKFNKEICNLKKWNYQGTAQVVMPENFITMFNAPTIDEAKPIIEKANITIDKTISLIKESKQIEDLKVTLFDKINSTLVNDFFYTFYVNDKKYYATDACVACGKCVKVCPLNNISLENGLPKWHGNCTQCMACICHCPMEAIEYGNKAKGKPRYHCD